MFNGFVKAKNGLSLRFADPILIISLIFVIGFVGISIIYPIFLMLKESLSATSLSLFERYLTTKTYQGIILNTIQLGLNVAAFGTLLGFIFAFVQVKLNVPFKRFMHLVAMIPIISPPFAAATSILTLFGRRGFISHNLLGLETDIYGVGGLSFVLILSLFTISYLNFKGMLQVLDPSLEEASTNLGANQWQTFRKVTLPMLIPGILGSFLLLFVEAIADLGNPLVLGGNFEVIATRIYISITGLYDIPAAAVFSVILIIPALTIFIVQHYWLNRISVVSVTGKPAGTARTINDPWIRWSLFTFVMGVCLLILLIYLTIVAGAFTKILGVNNRFTLEHFDYVINGLGAEAMLDTTSFALISTPIASVLGMLIAFFVIRKRFFGSGLLDFATMLGIAIPGTVIGIGFLLAFNAPLTVPFFGSEQGLTLIPKLTGGRAILGGAVAIILVYVVRSLPAALRSGAGALMQIDPSIEEASTSLGANNAQTFRHVTLPLIQPAFLASLIYAFARSMTTISAVIFLTTPQTRIMTQQILNETEQGRFGNAFAYSVILIAIVLLAIGILTLTIGSTNASEQALKGGL